MKSVILLKTQTCPYCPRAHQLWSELQKKYKFDYKVIDATSEEGMKLVQKFSIMAVPATIIDDEVKFVGIPNKEKAEEAVK